MIMEALTAVAPAHPGADRVDLERAFDWHAPGRTDLLCRSPRALEDALACNLAIYARKRQLLDSPRELPACSGASI
jgi:hypothetical protein